MIKGIKVLPLILGRRAAKAETGRILQTPAGIDNELKVARQ
jgi:hypothetical protein